MSPRSVTPAAHKARAAGPLRNRNAVARSSEPPDIVLEPITPMVWLTGDEAVLSLDIAGEVAWSF